MESEIVAYVEMCQREGLSLQRGMNFECGPNHSVILMSRRKNAPYRDEFLEDGKTLVYEGHDVPRIDGLRDPKAVDQPRQSPSGKLTQNGLFEEAAAAYKAGKKAASRIRVYEKIRQGIWADNGMFELVDLWLESDGQRQVFKFELQSIQEDADSAGQEAKQLQSRGRLIPTTVKLEVWKRDDGKCVECGAADELHFDHIVPFSKGGTSLTAANIQLLCARHNLSKRDKIR